MGIEKEGTIRHSTPEIGWSSCTNQNIYHTQNQVEYFGLDIMLLYNWLIWRGF